VNESTPLALSVGNPEADAVAEPENGGVDAIVVGVGRNTRQVVNTTSSAMGGVGAKGPGAIPDADAIGAEAATLALGMGAEAESLAMADTETPLVDGVADADTATPLADAIPDADAEAVTTGGVEVDNPSSFVKVSV